MWQILPLILLISLYTSWAPQLGIAHLFPLKAKSFFMIESDNFLLFTLVTNDLTIELQPDVF
jgi:hypothetical protein